MSSGGDPSGVRGDGESGPSGGDDRRAPGVRGTGGTAAAGVACDRYGAWGISGPTTGHSSGSK